MHESFCLFYSNSGRPVFLFLPHSVVLYQLFFINLLHFFLNFLFILLHVFLSFFFENNSFLFLFLPGFHQYFSSFSLFLQNLCHFRMNFVLYWRQHDSYDKIIMKLISLPVAKNTFSFVYLYELSLFQSLES